MIDKRTNDPLPGEDGEDSSGEDRADATLPPEAHNESQDDEGEQAQSLANEALAKFRGGNRQGYDDGDLGETERVSGGHSPALGDEESGSAPDLVDTMKEMVRGGRIDMGAFKGERNDDDDESGLGADGLEDDWPRGAE
jgi:hypothetical protein